MFWCEQKSSNMNNKKEIPRPCFQAFCQKCPYLHVVARNLSGIDTWEGFLQTSLLLKVKIKKLGLFTKNYVFPAAVTGLRKRPVFLCVFFLGGDECAFCFSTYLLMKGLGITRVQATGACSIQSEKPCIEIEIKVCSARPPQSW